jgi:bifunctional non-homologous end joining protein LigD
MVVFPSPMLATAGGKPFSSPDWLFEVKYDGYRMLAQFGAGAVALRTRGGHDCTTWFPEVTRALSRKRGGPYIVDGEVCVLDQMGRSDFDRLRARASRRCYYPECDPVIYCMFDLLVDAGADITHMPLIERKKRLARLFRRRPKYTLLVVEAIPEAGEELYALAERMKLEGLIAKRADSLYVAGDRTRDWRKLKRPGAVPPERFKRKGGT